MANLRPDTQQSKKGGYEASFVRAHVFALWWLNLSHLIERLPLQVFKPICNLKLPLVLSSGQSNVQVMVLNCAKPRMQACMGSGKPLIR